MTTSPLPDQLGGRLPLLRPERLDGPTRELHRRLTALVGPESAEAGYRAILDDGRLLGPFNAMLYTPALTAGLAQWTAQIAASGMDTQVREAIILTIGGQWQAPFEVYAHTAAARSAGLSEQTIAALLEGRLPPDASPQVSLAQRLTLALVGSHAVPAELYQDVIDVFGVDGTIACLHLMAQYQLISSLLVTFQVPVPTRALLDDDDHELSDKATGDQDR